MDGAWPIKLGRGTIMGFSKLNWPNCFLFTYFWVTESDNHSGFGWQSISWPLQGFGNLFGKCNRLTNCTGMYIDSRKRSWKFVQNYHYDFWTQRPKNIQKKPHWTSRPIFPNHEALDTFLPSWLTKITSCFPWTP